MSCVSNQETNSSDVMESIFDFRSGSFLTVFAISENPMFVSTVLLFSSPEISPA